MATVCMAAQDDAGAAWNSSGEMTPSWLASSAAKSCESDASWWRAHSSRALLSCEDAREDAVASSDRTVDWSSDMWERERAISKEEEKTLKRIFFHLFSVSVLLST